MANKLEVVYQNLSTMLSAGVPVLKALRTAGQAGKRRWTRAFNRLADRVADGDAIADAMQENRRQFVPIDIHLVNVGEQSGNLPLMLKQLSKWYALQNELTRRIISGMTLPFLIFHAAAFIIPAVDFLVSIILGGEITLYDYLWDVFHILKLLYIPLAIILFIIKCTPKEGPLRRLLDFLLLLIPYVGQAFKQLALSRFCRNFNLCYSAGVPMIDTCKIAMDASGNAIVASWFKPTIDVIREGKEVSEGLPQRRLPLEFLATWENGEMSGKLDFATDRLAAHNEGAATHKFNQIAAWVPRIFYGIICLFMIKNIFIMFTKAFSGLGI